MRSLEKYKLLLNKRRLIKNQLFYSISVYPIFCLIIVFLFFFNQCGFTQNYSGAQFIKKGQPTLRAYEKAGAKAFDKKEYGDAMAYYANAIKLDSTRIENYYKLGLAARAFKDNSIAKEAFMMVKKLNDPLQPYANYKNAIFYYSIIEKEEGNADNAMVLKEQLDSTYSIPAYTFNRIDNIADWDQIEPMCIVPDASTQMTITPLDTINTIYSEVNPFWRNGKLHYASLRFKKENDKGANQQKRIYAKTLQSELGKEGEAWMERKQEKQDSFIEMNIPNKTTAHFTFDPNEDLMYFTICDYVKGENSTIQCQIYYRVKTNTGWSTHRKVDDLINTPKYTTTHPAIGVNESGVKTLFYVSDRSGGKGGLDIWQAPILGPNNFGKPTPLSINTRKNDITPFYHHKTNTLYFSSQGNKAVKQYDIYKMSNEMVAGGWSTIEPLPFPINTNSDDFGYFLLPDGERGFMVSSRADCNELENGEWACHDIFQVDYCLPNLRIEPIDLETDSILTDVMVSLSVLMGKDTIQQKGASEDDFLFTNLDTSMTYLIKVEKKDYNSVFKEVKLTQCDTLNEIIRLEKACVDKIAVIALYDEETDLPITSSSEISISLNGATTLFRDRNEYFFTFAKILTDSVYKIEIISDDFNKKIVVDELRPCDTIKIELKTSPLAPPEFNTITCYFDHDRPRKEVKDDYEELYNTYLKRKPRYLFRFGGTIDTFDIDRACTLAQVNEGATVTEVCDFFAQKVEYNFNILERFKDSLIVNLDQLALEDSLAKRDSFYVKVEPYIIDFKGYTSPVGDTAYNRALAERRITSIRNYFLKDSRIAYYAFTKNLLVFEELAFGEDRELPIYEDEKDYTNTIYNPHSAKKRRVEIIRRRPEDITGQLSLKE